MNDKATNDVAPQSRTNGETLYSVGLVQGNILERLKTPESSVTKSDMIALVTAYPKDFAARKSEMFVAPSPESVVTIALEGLGDLVVLVEDGEDTRISRRKEVKKAREPEPIEPRAKAPAPRQQADPAEASEQRPITLAGLRRAKVMLLSQFSTRSKNTFLKDEIIRGARDSIMGSQLSTAEINKGWEDIENEKLIGSSYSNSDKNVHWQITGDGLKYRTKWRPVMMQGDSEALAR